ncbi:dihydrofolate reductase [Parahaliea maris]|uniref:Dihydrofolate reductase n=1 Tax=Parahaliea maris TaxID=2716870 RepID=A0A5C9A1S3_9GAMM|nr:dihydrofolate reductase [Parahaliea maris]TXS93944.1 dihydrofolate reductase [Parahaliea maris]
MNQVAVGVIVAVASNGVLGRDNELPWHLPKDLAYFKRTTLGKPIVMGRKTFESIGRPLPGRFNIVVSRNPDFAAAGTAVVDSLEAGLSLARERAAEDGVGEVMVIGGAQLYAEALPQADRLYVTEVHAEVEGDACLPPVDWSAWRELSRDHHNACDSNPFDYSFVVFEREQPTSR